MENNDSQGKSIDNENIENYRTYFETTLVVIQRFKFAYELYDFCNGDLNKYFNALQIKNENFNEYIQNMICDVDSELRWNELNMPVTIYKLYNEEVLIKLNKAIAPLLSTIGNEYSDSDVLFDLQLGAEGLYSIIEAYFDQTVMTAINGGKRDRKALYELIFRKYYDDRMTMINLAKLALTELPIQHTYKDPKTLRKALSRYQYLRPRNNT